MTRACWRTMACLLVVSLGGIVVWAEDPPKSPERIAPVPVQAKAPLPDSEPIPPPVISETKPPEPPPPAPVVSAPPPVVVPDAPAPVVPSRPPTPMPMSVPTVAVRPEPPSPPVVSPDADAPPLPSRYAAPPAPVEATPTVTAAPPPPPPTLTPVTPAAPQPMPNTVGTIALASTAPALVGVPASPPPPNSPFPWKLSLEVVNGLTKFELRRGDELLMQGQCERLDLHTPAGGLQALGQVTVTGPCVEARCDRLTIAWPSGQVGLDGSVRLAFQNRGVVHEMRAESVGFRLNGVSQPVDFSAHDVRPRTAPGSN